MMVRPGRFAIEASTSNLPVAGMSNAWWSMVSTVATAGLQLVRDRIGEEPPHQRVHVTVQSGRKQQPLGRWTESAPAEP